LHGFRGFLLGDDLAGVEFDQHRAISFDLFDGYTKPEVVQKQKLEFQVVKLWEWQSADLKKSVSHAHRHGHVKDLTFAYLEFV